jgi:rod shape determining protein RodA
MRYSSLRDLDWVMVAIAILISGVGVLQIYSATHDTIWQSSWWKQIVFIGVGLFIMWAMAAIDYHSLMGKAPIMYGASVALLITVLIIGAKIFGSRRWIPVFGFTFQVSEFMKVVLVIVMARLLTELRSDILDGWELTKLGAVVGIPMLLVRAQPDLGTALTYLPILGIGIYLAGLRKEYLLVIVLLVGLAPVVGWRFMHDYQKARLVSFLNPEQDPKGAGYQQIQSMIAVGAGGMWGQGVAKGTQTQLRFLPVAQTDFIFSAFAEEHGFIGVIGVLALYFVLLMQIVQNAQTAPDRAGMYICMGVVALFVFHLFVNVGMVVGRMPVVGIPLPLMSAGGSNTLSTFLMLGLVNNVRLRRFVN